MPSTESPPGDAPNNRLLRIGAAAAIVGIDKQTLGKLALIGSVPYYLLPGSGQRFFEREDCVQLRESMRRIERPKARQSRSPILAPAAKVSSIVLTTNGGDVGDTAKLAAMRERVAHARAVKASRRAEARS